MVTYTYGYLVVENRDEEKLASGSGFCIDFYTRYSFVEYRLPERKIDLRVYFLAFRE